jgi:leucyl aminopeptidase
MDEMHRNDRLLLSLLLVFALLSACYTPFRLIQPQDSPRTPSPLPAATDPAADVNTITATIPVPTPTHTVRPTRTFTPTEPALVPFELSGETCSFHPSVAAMLENTSAGRWLDWIEQLSGAKPVRIAGQETRITTRYSPSMFNGAENARAFDWLLEQVQQWYPEDQIEVQPFQVEFGNQAETWKNLIITIPGNTYPDEIVILSAHLDSTSEIPTESAPGAEDNGSGSATLIEAARLFQNVAFEHTLKIIWFTGEEQGLLGSRAFIRQADPDAIVGVVNLDMFGYDSDDDRCFELHVGTLPDSQRIGECFTRSINAYNLDLTYDYIQEEAIDLSDHGSFWQEKVGAIEVLEDLFEHNQPRGCPASDPNPYYHSTNDIVENLNPETAFAIVQAGIATAAGLAVPVEP